MSGVLAPAKSGWAWDLGLYMVGDHTGPAPSAACDTGIEDVGATMQARLKSVRIFFYLCLISFFN